MSPVPVTSTVIVSVRNVPHPLPFSQCTRPGVYHFGMTKWPVTTTGERQTRQITGSTTV